MPSFYFLEIKYCVIPHKKLMLKVKVKLNIEQAMKAQRGNRGIAVLFL